MSSDNITPPQISPEQLHEMALKEGDYDARQCCWSFNSDADMRCSLPNLLAAVIAERDRQWLERLEPVGETDLDGNLFASAALSDGTRLYRIREQE